MAPKLTVFGCFKEAPPDIDQSSAQYYRVYVRGTGSTATMDPPKFLIPLNPTAQELVKSANKFLLKNQNNEDMNHTVHSRCDNFRNALVVEIDVFRATCRYILDPIDCALGRCFPYGLPGEKKDGDTRSDLLVEIDGKCVAIIEFKRRGLIDVKEFQHAIKSEKPEKTKKRMESQDRNTYLEHNAFTFMKQAAAYAVQKECPYVVLFDWDSLILLNFSKMKLQDKYGGDWVQASIHCKADRALFRKLFLGFLLQCFGASSGK